MTVHLITEDAIPCTCGRSPTGYCTGLHKLSKEEWDARVFDEAFLNEQENKKDES